MLVVVEDSNRSRMEMDAKVTSELYGKGDKLVGVLFCPSKQAC